MSVLVRVRPGKDSGFRLVVRVVVGLPVGPSYDDWY